MPLLDFTGTFGLRVAGCDVSEVRIAGMGGRWERRVNLATNPGFEATSGTVVVRTNLCTTPTSYTPAADGPYPGLGAGPYTGSAEIGGVRQAVDPLALVGGVTYERLLIEAGSVPLGPYFDGSTRPVLRVESVLGGHAWTLAGAGEKNLAKIYSTGRVTVVVDITGELGQEAYPTWVSNSHANTPNATTTVKRSHDAINRCPISGGARMWITLNIPAGAASDYPTFKLGIAGEGRVSVTAFAYEGDYDPAREFVAPGQRDSTGLLCEWSGPVNASPSVVVDPDFTPAWTGPVGASTSVLRGQGVVNATATSSGHGYGVRIASSRWAASGGRSVRIIPNASSNDTYFGIGWFDVRGFDTFPVGRTFRISATLRLLAAQTGALRADARSITVYLGTSTVRHQAPNVPGEYPLSVTFTVPENATMAHARLCDGSGPGGGDAWWDDLTIEDITDATPTHDEPFHGDTPDTPDALYRWQDAPHASPTTAYYAWQPV